MQNGEQNGQQPSGPGWVYRPGDTSQPTQPSQETANVGSEKLVSPVPLASRQPVSEAPADDRRQVTGDNSSANSSSLPHIEWTASEFLANPKTAGWFAVLAIGSIVFAVVIYLLTKDLVPTIVIGLLGIIVGIAGARQPRVLNYSIDNTGLKIGDRFYPYMTFKSFSVAEDGAMGYISLLPLKRFMPPLTVHYDPQDEDKIVDTLAEYLPYEEHKKDVVDSISRKLRF